LIVKNTGPPADGERSMSRVVLLIEHAENRRLLAERLSRQHALEISEAPAALDDEFDLAIVDGPSLERYGRWIEAVKQSVHPLFLPCLLVTHRHGVGLATGHAWERVDELIVSPVEKVELDARVETLLRARSLSLANAMLRRRLERELARAREVQASLLPLASPPLRDFEIAAQCIPANEVGGDFFDWQAGEGAVVLSLGDVMGKGIPAALLAATVRAVLRALAHRSRPGSALDILRESLTDDLERASSFVTLFHAHLDVSSHVVSYVDAGHGHAFVRRKSGALERLSRGGRPVGFPQESDYREYQLELGPGDVLVVYSDGLIGSCAVLTPEQLAECVDAEVSAATIVERLVAKAPEEDTADDITVMVLKCTGV
jgi:serine phosphatase RsbU (regulator of sigma subunit)